MSDAPFIADCNRFLAQETEGRELEQPRVMAGVLALLEDPAKGTYLIAETNGTPVGQLLITYEWSDWRNGNFWWIQSLYVVESFRGKGVFRALFQRVHELAKARPEVCGLRLYMDADNARARQAYHRLGWQPTRYELFEIDFVLQQHG